jgi:uncharacterized protein YdaU (DUF1376 family)
MNYYPRNIGDYAAATAHLSDLEDLFYTRLIDRYYLTEGPLPLDVDSLCRFVRARSKEQRSAVEAVLAEFFTKSDEGYRQSRCDEEIAKFKEKAERSRANGKKSGGRPRNFSGDVPRGTEPKVEPKNNPAETQQVISRFPDSTQEQAGDNPTEKLTKNQEPRTNIPTSSDAAASPEPVDKSPPSEKPLPDRIFGEGLRFLIDRGTQEKNARQILGLLRGRHGDLGAWTLLEQALRDDVTDPVAWLMARTVARKSEVPRRQSLAEQSAAAVRTAREVFDAQ